MIRPFERLARRHPQINRLGQRGLALLDVLLGMAIFALIAVIAIQSMGMFRERAFVTQVMSDAKQLATGIEAGLTAPGATWEGLGLPDAGPISGEALSAAGVNLTGANAARVISRSGDDYSICAEHSDGPWAAYSSPGGAIHSTGRSGGCPAVLAVGPSSPGNTESGGDTVCAEATTPPVITGVEWREDDTLVVEGSGFCSIATMYHAAAAFGVGSPMGNAGVSPITSSFITPTVLSDSEIRVDATEVHLEPFGSSLAGIRGGFMKTVFLFLPSPDVNVAGPKWEIDVPAP